MFPPGWLPTSRILLHLDVTYTYDVAPGEPAAPIPVLYLPDQGISGSYRTTPSGVELTLNLDTERTAVQDAVNSWLAANTPGPGRLVYETHLDAQVSLNGSSTCSTDLLIDVDDDDLWLE